MEQQKPKNEEPKGPKLPPAKTDSTKVKTVKKKK